MAQAQLTGKLIIDAVLTVKTGLHIGGSSDFAPIGAVDSPFVRDPFTRRPVIPGSSVKGKMRTLLAKAKDGKMVLPELADDEAVVRRLFGASVKNEAQPSRLQFADSFVEEDKVKRYEAYDTDTYMGEVKWENVINRGTGVANPRQIERVPAGMRFAFRLVYNIENEADMAEDMDVLAEGFRLLQLDYLGGHGSRGYGRVAFSDFKVLKFDAVTAEKEDVPALAEKFEAAKL